MRFYEASPRHDLTYSDVFLVPGHSSVRSRLDVSLAPNDGTTATIPVVSANMNSVTGAAAGRALARRGGLGVLPQDLHLQDLDAAIRWVKEQPVHFDTALVLGPERDRGRCAPDPAGGAGRGIVVRDGDGEYLGCVLADTSAGCCRMPGSATSCTTQLASIDADDVTDARGGVRPHGRGRPRIRAGVHHGEVVGTISRAGALRSTLYQPTLDAHGRLCVAAAIGINGDVEDKAKALAAAGVDVLVLDTAHGHQDGMIKAIEAVAALGLSVPIVAGNVVTARRSPTWSRPERTSSRWASGPARCARPA